MSKKTFKLNRSGVRSMMQSPKMQDVLKGYATEIRNRCGPGYEQDIYVGRNRANAMVSASTYQARSDNLKNNTILKSVK